MVRALFLIGGLLLGFALGQWQAHDKLNKLEAQLAELEDCPDTSGPDLSFLTGLGGLAAGVPASRGSQPAVEPGLPGEPGADEERAHLGPGGPDGFHPPVRLDAGVADNPSTREDRREKVRERLALASEAQRIRLNQNRAALIEQSGWDEGQVAAFDAQTTEMSEKLATFADEIIAMTEGNETPAPRQMLSVSHDVLGILLDYQTRLDAQIPEGVDPKASLIWNYVDLDTLLGAMSRSPEELTQ